ncbi:hypothetical protein SEA_SKYSAND_86 [Gordonia phage Skysand]|uniref:Uncharacterized protein n=1 Tax=Gordonia phage Skysand TaxID=2301559 RepID=A0A385DU90_9CAUD|nr:hypothetical protein KNU08_gp86 [Gordonia phage Skysand]AXQ62119.1 hypothetical protein SEA_SKYSAND_86 [Gordonia phage Skysand]
MLTTQYDDAGNLQATSATVRQDITHRFGTMTATGTARTCIVVDRRGLGAVVPKSGLPRNGEHVYGGAAPWFHTDGRGIRHIDYNRRTGFYTRAYADRLLTELHNRALEGQRTPARGEIMTGPVALDIYNSDGRVTVNWRTRDGIEYWDDLVILDYARTGYRHYPSGVLEIGDTGEYLDAVRQDAHHRGYHVPARGLITERATGPALTGYLRADGRTLAEIVRCEECGRRWDDAVSTSVTPAPSGRCPFEYDHGRPSSLARLY